MQSLEQFGGSIQLTMMIRAILVATLLFVLGVTPVLSAPAPPFDLSRLEKFECPNALPPLFREDDGPAAHCVYLTVPERADGTGRKIKLAIVVIVPPDPANARRVPTVLLHGGPGIGMVDDWWAIAESALAYAGPLILFDHRGVGMSTPKTCGWLDTAYGDKIDFSKPFKDQLRMQIELCAAKMAKDGGDISQYGTHANARDMESIRTALGIETWNVYGFSYGTTVGLAYLAQYPKHARAAILDSVYPPEVGAFTNAIPNFLAAIEHMNAACAAQPRCKAKYGDIRASLHTAIKKLGRRPEPFEGLLSAPMLLGALEQHMLDIGQWTYLPKAIDDAARDRASPLLQRLMMDLYATDSDFGVWLATECRERTPFENRTLIDEQIARWPDIARAGDHRGWVEACDHWPSKLKENWTTPRDTPVPTLVVGGEWDYVTPARDSRATAAILGPRARFVLAARSAHSPTGADPCLSNMVIAFLQAPASKLDVRCAADIAPPTFAIDLIELPFFDVGAFWLITMNVNLETAGWIHLAAVFGLLSILVWPLQAFVTKATNAPWLRSSFWFVATLLGLVLWLAPIVAASSNNPDAVRWVVYGIPAEQWPTVALILPLAAPLAVGILALFGELTSRGLGVFGAFHRIYAALSLTLVFLTAWLLKLMPTNGADTISATQYIWAWLKPF
jgi:pimeloyl-ACP methyl ester carboxylesterase